MSQKITKTDSELRLESEEMKELAREFSNAQSWTIRIIIN